MLNKNKGITLIALVVTIVVLIILATISINAVMGDDGLIKRAEQASQHQANAEKSESDAIDQLLHQAGVAIGEIIENPYDPDGWTYAWVCTNGVWDNTKYEQSTDITEGEGVVVAKFYETGNKITPLNAIGDPMTEGNEYVMVIEGQGEMGALYGEEYYAWIKEWDLFDQGKTDKCEIIYVSKAMICEGVTNIGDYAFLYCLEMRDIILSNSVKSIGNCTFAYCAGLTELTTLKNVTNIGEMAFGYCTNIQKVTIPEGVTSLSAGIFYECTSLTDIIIPKNITNIDNYAFFNCNNLRDVYYKGNEIQWNTITIGSDNQSLTSATIYYD